MLEIITFINKFGYAIIENAVTITTDIQENKENFSRALQALYNAYNLEEGEYILKDFLSVWKENIGYSKGYLLDDMIDSMCYKTNDFITELTSHFYD